eukprot:619570-Hanusia_phi.AAC.1
MTGPPDSFTEPWAAAQTPRAYGSLGSRLSGSPGPGAAGPRRPPLRRYYGTHCTDGDPGGPR